MGRLFADATQEQERTFIEERRKYKFLTACRTPMLWLITAQNHKRAADILYEIAYEASERDMKRWIAEIKDGLPNGSRPKILKGQELIDEQNMDLIRDYFLLAGYALECVLKGYLIASRPGMIKEEKRLDKLIITHDLCRLCENCAIVLSQEEQDLLHLITRYIIWGKYAAPKKVEDMPSRVDPEDDKKKSLIINNPFYQRREQVLVNGIYQQGLTLLYNQRNTQT